MLCGFTFPRSRESQKASGLNEDSAWTTAKHKPLGSHFALLVELTLLSPELLPAFDSQPHYIKLVQAEFA
jgi:hypothetical protein